MQVFYHEAIDCFGLKSFFRQFSGPKKLLKRRVVDLQTVALSVVWSPSCLISPSSFSGALCLKGLCRVSCAFKLHLQHTVQIKSYLFSNTMRKGQKMWLGALQNRIEKKKVKIRLGKTSLTRSLPLSVCEVRLCRVQLPWAHLPSAGGPAHHPLHGQSGQHWDQGNQSTSSVLQCHIPINQSHSLQQPNSLSSSPDTNSSSCLSKLR